MNTKGTTPETGTFWKVKPFPHIIQTLVPKRASSYKVPVVETQLQDIEKTLKDTKRSFWLKPAARSMTILITIIQPLH